jgi:twitching motility two-component system response regulator PilH
MAVFDIFKRFKTPTTASAERREDERLRASLGARVLVVDDSATIRAVLGKMLMQDGYEVLKAADGESAIEMAQSQLPDLIFLDIVLPGLSGFAVLRALRREGATRTTPIIMMSGNQQATEQFYVQRFGADGFVKKPFGRAEVFHAIRSLVQAGRVSARIEAKPVNAIPEGISPEEWNAIPDVAMPDAAHLAALPPAAVAPATSLGASVEVGSHPPAPPRASGTPMRAGQSAVAGAWSGSAVSMAARPTLGRAAQAAVISVTSAVAQDHAAVPDGADAAQASPGGDKA